MAQQTILSPGTGTDDPACQEHRAAGKSTETGGTGFYRQDSFNTETNKLLSNADDFRKEIEALNNTVSSDVSKVTAATDLLHFAEKMKCCMTLIRSFWKTCQANHGKTAPSSVLNSNADFAWRKGYDNGTYTLRIQNWKRECGYWWNCRHEDKKTLWSLPGWCVLWGLR